MVDLEESPLYQNLESETIEALQERGGVLEQNQGDPLLRKDEPANDFYTILGGLIKVSVSNPLSERRETLTILGSGAVLGEIEFSRGRIEAVTLRPHAALNPLDRKGRLSDCYTRPGSTERMDVT